MTHLEELVHYAKKLITTGLVSGTSGNISFRDTSNNTMWITPTALPYEQMTVDDLVQVDLSTGEVVSGNRKPSSERPMHQSIYNQRGDIKAIVHTHSTYATMFAVAGKEIPPVHYLLADIGNGVPVAPYATYGSEQLARNAVEAMKGANGTLLANHGVIAVGPTLATAFNRAQVIEDVARLALGAHILGSYQLLNEEQLDDARAGFKTYFAQ